MKPGTKQYFHVHDWVGWRLGRPEACEVCGGNERSIDWANISGDYKKDTSDYAALCRSCHRDFDGHTGLRKRVCPSGHKKSGENLLVIKRTSRRTLEHACKTCYRERSKIAKRNTRLRRKLYVDNKELARS